eukprot:365182-Chlamydomonas_euryale.AAC.4
MACETGGIEGACKRRASTVGRGYVCMACAGKGWGMHGMRRQEEGSAWRAQAGGVDDAVLQRMRYERRFATRVGSERALVQRMAFADAAALAASRRTTAELVCLSRVKIFPITVMLSSGQRILSAEADAWPSKGVPRPFYTNAQMLYRAVTSSRECKGSVKHHVIRPWPWPWPAP